MRKLTAALVLAGSVAGAQAKPAAKTARGDVGAHVELPGPRLKLIDSVRVGAAADRFETPFVFLGPTGQLLIASSQYGGSVKAFDSTGRRLFTLDVGRDVRFIGAAGWLGSQLWIVDPGHRQIAILERGELTKSIEWPTWVRPKFSQRKSFPVFGGMEILAYQEDGSLIVVPNEAHSIVGTSGYDEKVSYVLKVDESGIIQQTIAKFPSLEYALRNSPNAVGRRNRYAFAVPDAHWPMYRVTPDGKRTVVVTVDTSSQKYDTVHVVTYDETGGVIFSRSVPYPARFYTDKEADSVAKERFSRMSYAFRGAATKATSRRAPSVSALTVGRDYSVWISLRQSSGSRPILALDAAGVPIGTLYAPVNFELKAADRGRIWASDAKEKAQSVVRYSISRSP